MSSAVATALRGAGRLWLCVSATIFCCALTGCGRKEQPQPAGLSISPPVETGIEVPYPQYANWSQFEVGTRVVRRKEVINPNGVVIETETLTLREKDDKRVVVESQTIVERSGGRIENNPPQTWEFPSTFRLPASVTLQQMSLPSIAAKITGTEAVVIDETSYEAQVYDWTEVNEAGPMTVRLLSAPNFPGNKLRQEMFTEQTQTRSVETIADVEIVRS